MTLTTDAAQKYICGYFFASRFPRKPELRQQWISALRRENFVPSASAVVCSKHFREDDFDRTSQSVVRLRENVVPSVFDAFPSYLKKVPKHVRRPPPHRPAATTVSDVVDSPVAGSSHSVSASLPVFVEESEYSLEDTPRKVSLKRKLHFTESKLMSSRKKIKLLQQSKRRLLKRNASLKSVIEELRKNDIMSTESLSTLHKCAGGVDDLIQRRNAKLSGTAHQLPYSPELRSFALTLYFYSPHAYRYVRKCFDTCLPHPRTIGKWYKTVNGRPGFTKEAFEALTKRSTASAAGGKRVVCSLMMDEVAIRQQLEWTGKDFQGYIDMGTGLDDDSLPLAKEALTFMVVAINDSFKLPVGYFLIDGLGGKERANLVCQCLERLQQCGITVVSLTFDGAASNLAMVNTLGCNLDVNSPDFKSSFKHPSADHNVHVFLDPCHMLKLVRNTLGDKKSLVDGNGNFVKWEYIENLHKLQNSEGLHLGNKLRSAHINWHKNKMNVRLAAQILSDSVATSLEFCMSEGLAGFEHCDATVKFIRMFNKLFDVLNSRNLQGHGFKSPIRPHNFDEVRNCLTECKAYIMSLKESVTGRSILLSNRKTGFVGFCVCINSVLGLYEYLFNSVEFGFKFLCTFKLSQDHLELFFSKIRRLGGCNNNPSATQFISAYRKLVVHNDLQDVLRGNCLPLETVPILTASSSYVTNIDSDPPSIAALNSCSTRSRIIDPDSSAVIDHDYTFIPNAGWLSSCSEKIVAYIAGFVVFKLKTTLHCETCIAALSDESCKDIHLLIKMKSKGFLIFPSQEVIDVCLSCEKYFRRNVALDSCPSNTSLHKLSQSVLQSFVNKCCFASLSAHMLECEPIDNHVILLTKAVIEKYLQVRYFYAGKHYTATLRDKHRKVSRQVNTKLVIFSGQ